METYTGKSIFNGIATGKILFFQKGPQQGSASSNCRLPSLYSLLIDEVQTLRS